MKFKAIILAVSTSILTLHVDHCYGSIRCYRTLNQEDSPTTNCTFLNIVIVCEDDDGVCWALVGIGGVIATILLIAVIVCLIFTGMVAKGINFLIQYFSTSARDNVEHVIERDHCQQQGPQNEGAQQTTRCHFPEPQYDSIENEQAPVHYFELEPPPQQANTKAKQQRKLVSRNHEAMAMSKLYSLPQLATPKEPPGEEYNPPSAQSYSREPKQDKVSAAPLPPSITQYSGGDAEDNPGREKAKELVPIYSIPDKSKKITKTIMEQNERETEQLSHSQTPDSFVNIKPPMTVDERGDRSMRLGSFSPPPPLLPPKPQQNYKLTEDAGENEKSMYAEASSKPLQVNSQRKTNNEWPVPTKTATVLSNISPFHLHAHRFQKEPG